jgi:hypothetical protein
MAELATFFMPISCFDTEDGGDMLIFQRTARHYIPEDRTLHNYNCENLKSCSLCFIQSLNPVDYFPAFLYRVSSTWERNQFGEL